MNEKNIKSILALVILLVAFSVLLIFFNNEDALMAPNVFPLFMTLSTVALGLLVGLLFLVNNSKHVPVKAKKTASRAVKSKKRK